MFPLVFFWLSTKKQRHRETPRNTERDTERHRETQRDTEKHRETLRGTVRPRETQRLGGLSGRGGVKTFYVDFELVCEVDFYVFCGKPKTLGKTKKTKKT